MNNDNVKSKKNLIIKIMIPVLIVCVVAVIWISKNSQTSASFVSDNPDFTLLITEEIDLDQLKSYGIPIIIDFGADSCIPCKEMAPVLDQLNEELQGKAIVRFVDVWKYPELAQNYPINVIPTQVLFDATGNPYTPKDVNKIPLNKYALKETNEHVFTTHEGGIKKEELLSMLKEMGLEE